MYGRPVHINVLGVCPHDSSLICLLISATPMIYRCWCFTGSVARLHSLSEECVHPRRPSESVSRLARASQTLTSHARPTVRRAPAGPPGTGSPALRCVLLPTRSCVPICAAHSRPTTGCFVSTRPYGDPYFGNFLLIHVKAAVQRAAENG